jgi:DNA-binding protein HU-beta
MNRTDLVNLVADASELPKGAIGKAVDATFDAITSALARGEEVAIKGFGTFAVIERLGAVLPNVLL